MTFTIAKPLIFIALVVLVVTDAAAQSEYRFRTGLAVSQVHRYGREAIVTDQVAYQLAIAQFQKPAIGGKIPGRETGSENSWEEVSVDSTGKFRGEALMNGYIYLTYEAPREMSALLNITGNIMCYFNGEPRAGDIYSDGWMYTPVRLKRGVNEILIRCGNFSRWQGVGARLIFDQRPVSLNTEDATTPHIVIGQNSDPLFGGIVIMNTTGKTMSGLRLTATLNGKQMETPVPDIHPYSIHKTRFDFDARGVPEKGEYTCTLRLTQNGKQVDEQRLQLTAVEKNQHHSYTFLSSIDGSVQYSSVAPQITDSDSGALFLSVHGAGVQAIGQARAYTPKDWGTLVAPTNRRPRGFNWEDWGRIDALEVLELAKRRFAPHPEKIYLTGHSMGGHGTWYLGATYPDKWAAIAPCAGYPTLSAYGSADGRIPDSARSQNESTLLRASNASNVIELAPNYRHHGVYIFHGDADRVVPVTFARQMRGVLSQFHPDFSYYEYPGGSHWFGNESVDWPPLFDFFRWHKLKHDSAVDMVQFITANPGVSATFRWATIVQQTHPLSFSNIQLTRDRNEREITGTTSNVAMLKLDLSNFQAGDRISLTLDSVAIDHSLSGEKELYLTRTDADWKITGAPDKTAKGPHRSGTFKEAFNHRMVFVYATGGNELENRWAYNKARYDAEVWYYRGNGAVDLIADHRFDPSSYPDRGIVLFGNASTNKAWPRLLQGCPIQVTRKGIRLGSRMFEGDDLAAYFTWPRHDSEIASVAVVSGTGLPGLHAAEANQYFAAGSGYPDYIVFSVNMLRTGAEAINATGFFENDWSLPARQ